jgi:HAD superfamily hydrolase (TIGR01509 family)
MAQKAVLFDLDGTLIDSNYLHTMAWWRALDDAGERHPMAHIHRLIGMGSSELLTKLLEHDDPRISESQGEYFRQLHPLITLLPGATQLLHEIKQRGGLAVLVTSSKRSDLNVLLANLRIDEIFDVIVAGDDADQAKPHPDLFALGLRRSETEPRSVVAIGDAIWDVKAAGRAGIGCIAVESGGFSESELRNAGALAVYQSCAEILRQWRHSPIAALFAE